jgi:hypothetical protein
MMMDRIEALSKCADRKKAPARVVAKPQKCGDTDMVRSHDKEIRASVPWLAPFTQPAVTNEAIDPTVASTRKQSALVEFNHRCDARLGKFQRGAIKSHPT